MLINPDSLSVQLSLSGISCFFAQLTVHWIETAMVRQQISATGNIGFLRMALDVARKEGAGALYRGIEAASLRELSYSSLRFGLYEPFKELLGAGDPATAPFYKKVMAGLAAGALAAAVASPTDLLKIKAQSDVGNTPKSLSHHFLDVWKDRGAKTPFASISNFYRGVSTTVTRAAVIGATKMSTYDQTKTILRARMKLRDEVPWERYTLQLYASVATGLAIALTSSPATNARTLIMASDAGKYRGMMHCMYDIVRTRGFLGLYRGFGAQWARVGPYAVVQFFVWEQLRLLVGLRPL